MVFSEIKTLGCVISKEMKQIYLMFMTRERESPGISLLLTQDFVFYGR